MTSHAGIVLSLLLAGCVTEQRAAEPDPEALALGGLGSAESDPLASTMREVQIEMYMTTWCGVCRRASAFLQARGYRVNEHDVESDDDAAEIHRRLNPRGSVPTFAIEGYTLIGFAPGLVDRAVTIAALRRLEQGQPAVVE